MKKSKAIYKKRVIIFVIVLCGAWGLYFNAPYIMKVIQKTPEHVETKVSEVPADSSQNISEEDIENKNQEETKIKVPPIGKEKPYRYVSVETKESITKNKELAKQFDKKPNIKGEEIVDELATSGTDDIVLTNKNDRLSHKEQDKKNVNQSNSSSANTPDEMVTDNTPYFEAEPEQKNDIVWEDGGGVSKSEQVSETVPSGKSTGGYLN